MAKKILITGVTGFAGNYLARQLISPDNEIFGTYLSENSLPVISDISSQLTPIKLDLMQKDAVNKVIEDIKPDEMYHLAAIASTSRSFNDPSLVITNNISSQLNLLEAIRNTKLNTRVMVISSAEVYGKVDPSDLPIDEETPLKPENPYAVSKIAQDFLGLQYNIAYGMNIIRVRPCNHIGPGQTDQFAVASFAKKIAEIEKGKRKVLTVGNLEAKRDFTDVKDMMRAYIVLMEKGNAGDVYNIGSGVSHKMSEILNMLISYSNVEIKIEEDPALLRPSDNPDLICDNTKITTLTGWKPEIPLEKTLKDTLDYWRNII